MSRTFRTLALSAALLATTATAFACARWYKSATKGWTVHVDVGFADFVFLRFVSLIDTGPE